MTTLREPEFKKRMFFKDKKVLLTLLGSGLALLFVSCATDEPRRHPDQGAGTLDTESASLDNEGSPEAQASDDSAPNPKSSNSSPNLSDESLLLSEGEGTPSSSASASSSSNTSASTSASLQPAGSFHLEITDLRYVASRNGGTVIVRTDGPTRYRIRENLKQKQITLELAQIRLPDRLKRPYITSEFNQLISAINAYQDSSASTARIVMQLRSEEKLRVEQRGNEIFLAPESTAAGSSIAVSSAEIDDDANEKSKKLKSYAGTANRELAGHTQQSDDSLKNISLDELSFGSVKFTGKPINIEVRETNIRDVIAFIAEQSGANLVVTEEVKGTISLKLRQVPWDQALLIIMRSKQLGYVRQGNVLRIAPLDLLQQETENARRVLEAQRAAEPLRVRVVPISYGNVTDLATQVKEFLSTRGKVVSDSRTSSLIITDIIENIERATNLIKALDIPPLQVQIEAKVVEAQEGFSREFGINWHLAGSEIPFGGSSILPNLSVTPDLAGGNGGALSVAIPRLANLGGLDAILGLFEEDRMVKVISSPKIVTMNNKAANIKQVEQIPITSTTAGTSTSPALTTVSYKDVSLSLDVTPQITAESDILMTVNVKREFVGSKSTGASAPPINTREAKTDVMVKNGQTAVIGGIYKNDNTKIDGGIPFFKDIPLIGFLFKSTRSQIDKNELLLFITPRILNQGEGTVKSGEL